VGDPNVADLKQKTFPKIARSHNENQMPMKLIGSNTSPYVRKVRVVMAEKKLDYDFVT
jgi:hypothetical protein